MQKTVLILIFFFNCTQSVLSQSSKAYNSWDDVTLGILNKEEDAAFLLLNLKEQIESSSEWSKNTKDTYITSIQLLNEYCSIMGYYSDQETILNNAIKTFSERDSIFNTNYMRKLRVFKMKAFGEVRDIDHGIDYGLKTFTMFDNANDNGYDYTLLCLNLATLFLYKGDLTMANLYADEALDVSNYLIQQYNIPKEWGYYLILNIKGMIYLNLKDYNNAINYLKEVVINTNESQMGYHYYNTVNNLAVAYLFTEKNKECIHLLEKIQRTTPDLKYYVNQNLAMAHHFENDSMQTSKYLSDFNKEFYINTMKVIANSSELERDFYLHSRGLDIAFLNNLMSFGSHFPTSDAFDANLYSRSINLAINNTLKTNYSNEPQYQLLSSLHQTLTSKTVSNTKKDSVIDEIKEIEKVLLKSDNSLFEKIKLHIGSHKSISQNINKNEAFVLFCYLPQCKTINNVELYYGAFILKHKSAQPILVKLEATSEVESIFEHNFFSIELISALYSEHNAKKLYKSLWEPLEPYLENIDNIYYSTIGPLASINFDALMNKDGQRLRDFKNLTMLSSPTIKEQLTSSYDYSSFFAIGSPSFNLSQKEMAEKASEYENFSGTDISDNLALFREKLRGDWQEIPGTRKEIESIHSLFSNKEIESKIYIGKDATEESIKALSGKSPKILHFATHGFAISTIEQYNNTPFVQSLQSLSERNSYMMWSGLVLAGGNNTWNGKFPPENVEDGILTAEEISRLDLSNTDLVVLSACETARGHIDPLEGVWGLQRAFKLAGAKTILMTLWKVSDEITAMFMEEFYKQLLNGKSVRQSVKEAQDYLIQNGASDPFYWAPFVVLD